MKIKRTEKHHSSNITILKINIFSVMASFLFWPVSAIGQGHNERVTIVGAYQPSLKDVQKIAVNPGETNLQGEIGEQTYSNLGIRYQTQASTSPIAYTQVRDDEKKEINRNFVDAAIGSNLSPVFNFRHRSRLTDKTLLDLGLGHWSTWVNIKDRAPSDRMHNQLHTGIQYDFSNQIWQNDLTYNHDFLHYYGFKPSDFPDVRVKADSLLQTYQRLGFTSRLKSNQTGKEVLNHDIAFRYRHFADDFRNIEQSITLSAGLKKDYAWFASNSRQFVGLNAAASLFSADDSLAGWRGFYARLEPSIHFSGSFFELTAALKGHLGDDTTTFFSLHPQLHGKLFVFDDRLQLYAGFGGDKILNTLEQNTLETPYLKPGAARWWTNTTHDFKAGIRTSLIPNLDFHIGIQTQKVLNGGFIINDSLSIFKHQLTFVHDDFSEFGFIAEAGYHQGDKINALFQFGFDQYKMEKLLKPWHKPSWHSTLDLSYRHDERWRFNSQLFLIGKRYAPTAASIRVLPTAFDLNLNATYQLNPIVGFYAKAANILNNRYEIWDQYPVQGTQLFVGATLKF